MSTRSRIGVIRKQGGSKSPTVESIYCHFDGYPEGVGQMLLDHWTDFEDINRLIDLGDLSSLGSVIGEKHNFDTHTGHSLDGYNENCPMAKGWCCAYGRDRGEEDVGSRTHSIDKWPDYGQEAEYVFNPSNGEWRVRRQDLNPVGWNTVTPWEGWITIPEAIELEQQVEARLG